MVFVHCREFTVFSFYDIKDHEYPCLNLSYTNSLISFDKSQDEIISAGGQVEPPGMHMIYLPYSEDIRNTEEARDIIESVT